MKNFFEAKTIVVIGASRDPNKVGNAIFKSLLQGGKKVFPINPNAPEILGKKTFPSVLSVPFIIDLAVITLPAELVPQALEECGRKNVKNIIIVSAGFKEAGNNELQEKVESIIKKHNLKVLGPNVLGIINPYKDLNASFFKDMPEKGNVAFVSQSGAVGTSFLDMAIERNFGISGFVSLGNMLQQDFLNALDYFGNDVRTEVIALYVESLKDGTGKLFLDLCKQISKKKRIIVLKAGKTSQGEKAARTHTASLSSSSMIYSGVFKQAGVIEVDSLKELFTLSEVFSKYKSLGKRAGIVTNAGGLGVLCVDSLVKNGFEVPEIPEQVLAELDKFLPRGYSRGNPLDILGDALDDRYSKTLRILNMYKIFDFFVVIVSPQKMTNALEIASALVNRGFPVFPCFIGGASFIQAKEVLKKNLVNFDDVNDVGEILGKALVK